MSDDIECWLVRREYTDKGLITLEYATPDGTRSFVKQISPNAPSPTAARDVDESDLQPVEDPNTQERYETEVQRMRESNDPDDVV